MSDIHASDLERFAEAWLAWILSASWQLALVVAIVGVVTAGLHWASPRLRHALWLLVLVKVFLPPSLTTPVSLGRLVVAPLAAVSGSWVRNPFAQPAPSDEDADEIEI